MKLLLLQTRSTFSWPNTSIVLRHREETEQRNWWKGERKKWKMPQERKQLERAWKSGFEANVHVVPPISCYQAGERLCNSWRGRRIISGESDASQWFHSGRWLNNFISHIKFIADSKGSKINLRIKSIVAASLSHDNRWCTATNLAHHARATCTE